MKKRGCPSCGAEVPFSSSLSVYAVCKYCGTMVVRHDEDVTKIGVMAALPDDMSPLHIGTSGTVDDLSFTIIGRMKLGWDDGVWNEWFLYTDDGKRAWLAEAQGSFAISFEVAEALHPSTRTALHRRARGVLGSERYDAHDGTIADYGTAELGNYVAVKDEKFKVMDVKAVTCIGSEGELPFRAPAGRKTLTIDLMADDGRFASVEFLGKEERTYIGRYVEWDDMNCRNLRPLEGW